MITNKFSLPEPLYKALAKKRYAPIAGRISATALIDAPLIRVLLMKHTDEIVEDASEKIWALLGSAIHRVIELKGTKEASELKCTCKHESGATLVSIGDYYENNILTDWKITSVWSYLLGGKASWEKQLNVVRYIYGKNDLPVKEMNVYAILRDWQQGKVYEHNYPQIPFQECKIDMWDDGKLKEYIDERVSAHLFAESMINDLANVPQCSAEERWQRPTTYAVKRPKIKRAVRVFELYGEAEEYLGKQKDGTLYIETREGLSVKCEKYCPVNKFCPYYKPNDGQEGE